MKRRHLLQGWASGLLAATSGTACSQSDKPALWYSYGGKNRATLLALLADYNQEFPEHALTPVYQGDYFELLAKFRTALHAGKAPAVTHVIAEIMPYLVEAKVLRELGGLEGLGGDLDLVQGLSQQGCFSQPAPTGLFGIPFNRSTPIAYLNGQVLDELKMSPPTTWEQWSAFALAATRGEGADRRWGFACPIDWWFWVAMVGQAGGAVANEQGQFDLGGDAGVRALSFWQKLVYEDRVMRPPPGRDYNAWQVTNSEFLAGRVSMIWNSTAFVRYLEDNAKFPVVCAPLPRDQRHAVPTGGTMFVVPAKNPPAWDEAARRFLAFMVRPERANQFATNTGYIPVVNGGIRQLESEGYYQKRPNDRVAVDQLAHAIPWPWHRELFRVQREVVQSRLEQAVLLRRDPVEAMREARAAIEETR